MGFNLKVKGITGLPNWTSGEVKNLVVDEKGILYKKETSSNEIIYRPDAAVTGIQGTTYVNVDGIEADLESDTLYLINFHFRGRAVGPNGVGGYKIKTEFSGTGTVISGSLTSETSDDGGAFSYPVNFGKVGEVLLKTTSTGTITISVAQHTYNAAQSVEYSEDNVIIVRKLN